MDLTITDLDSDPSLAPAVLALFRGCPPGREHAVCGEPARMGQTPELTDLHDSLGVVIAHRTGAVAGALAICPYSEDQVTLWGPVIHRGMVRQGIGTLLLAEARAAIADGGWGGIRVLVDIRNRTARAFFLANGLTPWKDNVLYERSLSSPLPPDPGAVSIARPGDHPAVIGVLTSAFPDSAHCERPLAERERAGWRHHLLQDGGRIVAAAAVKAGGSRSWIGLIGVLPAQRGRGLGARLLAGLLHQETRLGASSIGLEVLDDNLAANRLYGQLGFTRSWSATILTGPV